MTVERVYFRLIETPCCTHMLCWVNPRWPSFCPACGKGIYPEVKGCAIAEDDMATLRLADNMVQQSLSRRTASHNTTPDFTTLTQGMSGELPRDCPSPTRWGSDELVCPGCALRWDTNEEKPSCPRTNA